ncbi:putative EMP1-like protein, partial [Plasmodium gaboni]
YGDIIKGTDMIDSVAFKDIKGKLEKVLKKNSNGTTTPEDWWKKNKKYVWHAMLCGYKKTGYMPDPYGSICIEPDTDETPQFLRWMIEWAKIFCNEKRSKRTYILNHCKDSMDNNKNHAKLTDTYECKTAVEDYLQRSRNINDKWTGLSEKFNRSKKTLPNAYRKYSPEKYLKSKCGDCDCKYQDLQDIVDADKDVKITDDVIEKIIDQAKNDKEQTPWSWVYPSSWPTWKINGLPKWTMDGSISIKWPTFEWPKIDWEQPVSKIIDSVMNISDIISHIVKNTKIIPTEKYKPQPDSSNKKNEPNVDINSKQHNQSFQLYERPEIIVPTIGAVAATILGIMLYKWRSPLRSKVHIDDMFRVLEMPQNDYNIPDKISSNRYVPYGKYKGKTYLYVEGEETDDYIGNISSSDITSSSESEYEEMDINDIYPYKSPKYKTLIEVVLKPSTNNNVQDTYTDDVKNNSDIP